MHAYAGGGFDFSGDVANRHVPAIYSAGGAVRAFAEPETQGELYAPLANDWRRPRAKALVSQVVSRFGGDVTWHAAGSISASQLGGGRAHIDYARLGTEVAKAVAGRDLPNMVIVSGEDATTAAQVAVREFVYERDSS